MEPGEKKELSSKDKYAKYVESRQNKILSLGELFSSPDKISAEDLKALRGIGVQDKTEEMETTVTEDVKWNEKAKRHRK